MAADHAQAAQGSGAEDSERGRLGNRIECLEAGLPKILGGREYVGGAVSAPQFSQAAVEAGECIAAAKGIESCEHIAVGDVVGDFELELRLGEFRWRQSHLIDDRVLAVNIVDPLELQHGTGIYLAYPHMKD